jgi:hypothetical protein
VYPFQNLGSERYRLYYAAVAVGRERSELF